MSHVVVTGGAGYIGSHTCLELLEAGYGVSVIDNLCNSSEEALRRVERISGKSLRFYRVDLLDRPALAAAFDAGPEPSAVIHFAGLKSVGESVAQPLRYYHNNLTGTVHLCEVMRERGVKSLVFSSSATVYGDPERVPIPEDAPLRCTNPYGRTKLIIEELLADLVVADPEWSVVRLRYFNPVGAHPSGLIGEDPNGIPNNLMPFVSQVAIGLREKLRVFGNDYPTPDGTGIRDYIHVVDLARGHLRALKKLRERPGILTYNLGTGRGCSVLEIVRAFERASGRSVPYDIVDRRPGDVACCSADPTLARVELGWAAELDIDAMCADTWRWQTRNPDGFRVA